MIRTVDATDMCYCRDHVDCVCLCRLVFVRDTYNVYSVNLDGSGKKEIVPILIVDLTLYGMSLDHNNHVCWSQEGKGSTNCFKVFLTFLTFSVDS